MGLRRMIAVHNHIEKMKEEGQMEKLAESIAERMFGEVDEYTRAIAEASINDVFSAVEEGKILLRKVPPKLPGELSRDVTGDDQLMIIIGASQGGAR